MPCGIGIPCHTGPRCRFSGVWTIPLLRTRRVCLSGKRARLYAILCQVLEAALVVRVLLLADRALSRPLRVPRQGQRLGQLPVQGRNDKWSFQYTQGRGQSWLQKRLPRESTSRIIVLAVAKWDARSACM